MSRYSHVGVRWNLFFNFICSINWFIQNSNWLAHRQTVWIIFNKDMIGSRFRGNPSPAWIEMNFWRPENSVKTGRAQVGGSGRILEPVHLSSLSQNSTCFWLTSYSKQLHNNKNHQDSTRPVNTYIILKCFKAYINERFTVDDSREFYFHHTVCGYNNA